jgi:hypothetical protein
MPRVFSINILAVIDGDSFLSPYILPTHSMVALLFETHFATVTGRYLIA